jgi:hypothetical protein
LRYADTIGAAEIVRRLATLAREVAPHFAPCAWLVEMAREGRGFYSGPAQRPPVRPDRQEHPQPPQPHAMTPAAA